ncbi:MFS transporter, partial [Streptomyces sp. SID7958]|nr:MFS transporter [Streptomyces sp. SID7958]
PAWWVLAGCGLAVLVVGALTSGRWARGTALRTAERLESAEIREAAGVGR